MITDNKGTLLMEMEELLKNFPEEGLPPQTREMFLDFMNGMAVDQLMLVALMMSVAGWAAVEKKPAFDRFNTAVNV